ncbi:hypothetical protein N44_04667 [Microcystis aeruginosa NIES-44]|uniref:Uncharacterized protein n=1 Tax=Microcystis aeruginosa NIES-44 TaxID=449439 RepID=A0A0A1W2Q6_MICAE|nr:hypothetical protein N44_04667 [Microcystis aeruginosa NIES-44]
MDFHRIEPSSGLINFLAYINKKNNLKLINNLWFLDLSNQ